MSRFLGFDIGGTKCSVVLGDEAGRILSFERVPTAVGGDPGRFIAGLCDAARGLLAAAGMDEGGLAAAGVSCGGPLDARRGLVLSPPNLPGWDEVPIVELISRRLGGLPVSLRNDADACALAEWRWGAGRGCRHMVFLTFGTGMGSGLILDGRLYAGSLGLAGEVGHLRLAPDGPLGHGKAGSFEGFCSGGGITRMAQAAARDAWAGGGSVGYCTPETIEALSAQSVAARARSGDPDARRIIELSAEQLGRGLAVLVDILNPELIVIGGIYMRNLDLFEDAVMRVLRAEALAASAEACRVAPAALGERIGDCAALVAAIGEEVR